MKVKSKCPECNKWLTSLDNITTGNVTYYLSIDKDGDINYSQDIHSFNPDGIVNEYWCPECNEMLFQDEEEAINFLKGKIKEEKPK